MITKFIERVSRGLPPIIYGDGQQTRDFVYVEDVAEAIAKAVGKELDKEVINIATGKPTKIIDLAKLVMKLFENEDLKPVFENPRPGDIRHSYALITKAVEKLGWKPHTGLEEGLEKTVEWFIG
ncbi:MAG: hypothetical protein DRJ44_03445 [Thermoprotei archaeon]|nr:MAG: hypothetical protein DRJ44_03445 [Thermoprotei archaeon]